MASATECLRGGGRGFSIALRLLFAFLLLLPLACHLGQAEEEEPYLDLSKLYDSLGGYDSIQVRLVDEEGKVLQVPFHGELKAKEDLKDMPVPGYRGERVVLSIVGYKDGKVVYHVDRYYDGARGHVDSARVSLSPGMEVKLDSARAEIVLGDSALLPGVAVRPDNLHDKAVIWAVLDPDYLSLGKAHFKGLKVGTGRLLASLASDTSVHATFSVQINPKAAGPARVPDSLQVKPEVLTVALNGAAQGFTCKAFPDTADPAVTWASEDPAAVSVSSTGAAQGLRKGRYKVWAASVRDPLIADTAVVEVTEEAKVDSVRLPAASLDVLVGTSTALSARVYPPEADQRVELAVDDTSVARIVDGLLEARKEGDTKVRARSLKDTSKADTMGIKVRKLQVVTGVLVDPRDIRLFTGGATQVLTAAVSPNSVSQAVSWRTSDSTVATVNDSGRVSPRGVGLAWISAASKLDPYRSDSVPVTVKTDGPKLSVGRDTTVPVGTRVVFHPKVSQEHGTVVAFQWDLDGDGQYDGTALAPDSLKEPLSYLYDKEKDYATRFYVKDSEGNDTTVTRLIRVRSGPLVLIKSPLDSAQVKQASIDIVWTVNGIVQETGTQETLAKEGANEVTRTFKDSTGREYSDTITVILDRAAPTKPEVHGVAATRFRNPAWSWKSGGGGNGVFRHRLDTLDLSGAAESTDTVRVASQLSEGKHILYVQERDIAGNWSSSGQIETVVDLTPPPVPTVGSAASLTNNRTPTWSWDNGIPVESGPFQYKLDDSVFSSGAITTTEKSFTPAANLAAGPHTLYVRQLDAVGNPSAPGRYQVTIDVTPPAMPLVSVTAGGLKPTWSWGTGGGNGNGTWRRKLDDTTLSAGATETTTASYTPTDGLSEGEHILYVQERDAAGNWSPAGSKAVIAVKLPNTLSDEEKAQGFALLYDGTLASFNASFVNYEKNNASNTTLSTGWTTDSAGSIVTAGNTSNIRSTRTYGNFDFRMEYRNDGNQGIIYRHLLTGDAAWQTGVEFAVNNDSNKTKASPGAAYDLYAPSPNAYSVYGSGKWNSARIVAVGDSVEHWMNGVKVVGYKYHSPAWWTAYSASKWESLQTMSFKVPGNKTEGYITEGYLGLEGDHGGKWQIRNIRINSTNPKLGPP